VLSLAGKLVYLDHFTEIMDQYHYKLIMSDDANHNIYLLSP